MPSHPLLKKKSKICAAKYTYISTYTGINPYINGYTMHFGTKLNQVQFTFSYRTVRF